MGSGEYQRSLDTSLINKCDDMTGDDQGLLEMIIENKGTDEIGGGWS